MIKGSSLFGIDITKGIIKDDSLDDSFEQQHDVEVEHITDEFVDENVTVDEFSDDEPHVLPGKSNDVRRDLMYETDNIVNDIHRNGRERNL